MKFLPIITAIIGIGVIIWFPGFMNTPVDCNSIYKNVSYEHKIPIVSLNDNWKTSGSFFLGSGSEKSRSYYVFYTGDSTNGYSLERVETNGVKIFMDEDISPYYITKTRWVPWLNACMPVTISEIHVPNGTIVKSYNLDGE